MKPTTIENIIAEEILDRYNNGAFFKRDIFFDFDYDNDTVVEVTGCMKESYVGSRYNEDMRTFVETSIDVTKVEFFNEDGLIPIRIDLAKIGRLVEMDIR